MAKIILDNFNLGGVADSIYLGTEGSVAAMVGMDIHSTPGLLKVNQKLSKESGTTITVRINCMIQCSNGKTYLFGNSGKIYSRTSFGVYTLEATAAPSVGSADITGAIEDQGKIYYFMGDKVGRWLISTNDWSTRNDSWATFSSSVATAKPHPAIQVNLVNYIGDGNYIAQIEDDVFTGIALDLKVGVEIRTLAKLITELLIGTYISDNVSWADVYRWNTWSDSFSSSDPVPETSINAFLPMDNFVLAQVGFKGGIYVYSNDRLERFMRIPGNWEKGARAEVFPWATANRNGVPLFALSAGGGVALSGVYSLGSYSPNYPTVLNIEHVPSIGGTGGGKLTAMVMAGDKLLVAWDDGGFPANYGIDVVDFTAKYDSAYLESRVIMLDRSSLERYAKVLVAYKSLPTGTGVNIKANVNHAGFGSAITTNNDIDRKIIETTVGIENAATLQIRIEPTVSGDNAPEIERIEIITP